MAIEKCISLDATHETSTIGDADTVLVGVGVQSSTGPIAVMPFLDSTTGFQVRKADGSTPVVNVDTTNARMRIGNGDVPTANLDLKYGSVAAPTLRIGSGTVSTAVVNGAVEYDGTHFYGSTGGSRYQLDQQAGGGPTGFTTPSAKFNTALGIATGTDANLYKMTAIGFNACNATAVGTGSIGDSVAIGAYACDTSAKVSNCCFAGGAAGMNSSGYYGANSMTGIGWQALKDASDSHQYNYWTAGGSTAIGCEAGKECLYTNSVYVGRCAGRGSASPGTTLPTIISDTTSENGDSNIFIGFSSGPAGTWTYPDNLNLTGAIAIGATARVGASNCISIGHGAVANTTAGNIQIGIGTNSRSPACVQFGTGGSCLPVFGGVYTQDSDERIKKDISPLTTNEGLSFLNTLSPVSFKFKELPDSQPSNFGLVAQQVKIAMEAAGLLNYLVVSETPSFPWGIAYSQLIAPMIKAIQELSSALTDLQQEVSSLKK